MIRRLSSLVTFAAALCLVSIASAQAPGGMARGMGAGPSGMDTRFMAAVPAIGEQIPDITIVDDQGNPVSMRDITTGQYTVLTLGCLT
ncbi:MAG: hypothetical protein O6700_05965 [Gammaproteobacteria bacterium]|nr:hypothetical protein [Gammaproteobacteria bacterium]MCZ6498424.1 hypothetical protein [Gammaproteobacteria bacterium]